MASQDERCCPNQCCNYVHHCKESDVRNERYWGGEFVHYGRLRAAMMMQRLRVNNMLEYRREYKLCTHRFRHHPRRHRLLCHGAETTAKIDGCISQTRLRAVVSKSTASTAESLLAAARRTAGVDCHGQRQVVLLVVFR